MIKILLIITTLYSLSFADVKEDIMNDTTEMSDIKIEKENKYNQIRKFREDTKKNKEVDLFNYQKEKLITKLKIQIIFRIKQLECIEKTKNQSDNYKCGDSSIKLLNEAVRKAKIEEWKHSDYELEKILKSANIKTYE